MVSPDTTELKVPIVTDIANLALLVDVATLDAGSRPVSVSIKQDGTIAYVAAEGESTVREVRLEDGFLLPTALPASGLGTLRRIVAQRVTP